MSNQLATQDNKLKIYFEDESIKVVHNVEYYVINFESNGKQIDKIEWLRKGKDLQFSVIQQPDRYETNYPKSLLQEDGNCLRNTINKEEWEQDYIYSYSSNKIIQIDYEGEPVFQLIRKND